LKWICPQFYFIIQPLLVDYELFKFCFERWSPGFIFSYAANLKHPATERPLKYAKSQVSKEAFVEKLNCYSNA